MEDNVVNSTIAERPKKAFRIFYYITLALSIAFLTAGVYYGFKCSYIILFFILVPFVALSDRFLSRIKGTCPHCGAHVRGIPRSNALTCDACQNRMVFRDGRFWQLPKDPVASDDLILPPGMTPEEFTLRKEKLKRKAITSFALLGLFLTFVIVSLVWVYGLLEPYQTKTIQELQVARGTYYVRTFYSGRTPDYETGIKDSNSSKVIVTIRGDGFCGISRDRWSLVGKPVVAWYATGVGGGKTKILYQLEVSGHTVCTVDQVNEQIIESNARWKFFAPLIVGGLFLLMWSAAAIQGYYGTYRKGLNDLFGKEK